MDWYYKFLDYQYSKGITQNTVTKNVKILKTFLNEMHKKGKNEFMYFKHFSSSESPGDSVYLNEEEIQKIAEADVMRESYRGVKDLFLMACYSGLRYSDISNIKKSNLRMIQGKPIVTITQSKTEDQVSFPLSESMKKIMDKYDWDLPRVPSNQKFNEYIKKRSVRFPRSTIKSRSEKDTGIMSRLKHLRNGRSFLPILPGAASQPTLTFQAYPL